MQLSALTVAVASMAAVQANTIRLCMDIGDSNTEPGEDTSCVTSWQKVYTLVAC